MNWKTENETYLIEKNKFRIPFIEEGIGFEGLRKFDKSAEYYETDKSGIVIKKYFAPRFLSLEDELMVTNIHLVIGDSLYKFYWIRHSSHKPVVAAVSLLQGLRRCENPLPFVAKAAIQTYERFQAGGQSNFVDKSSVQSSIRKVKAGLNKKPIPVGKPHRAACDLEMRVYDYDDMNVEMKTLPAGNVFQPWKPLEHWQGDKVPITLGDRAKEFDWMITSREGHFLEWKDFFHHCRIIALGADDSDF